MFTQVWCPTEFSLLALSINSGPQISETVRNATLEIYVPSLKWQLVAGSWKWFCQRISTELGAVHDSYIAKYDAGFLEVK